MIERGDCDLKADTANCQPLLGGHAAADIPIAKHVIKVRERLFRFDGVIVCIGLKSGAPSHIRAGLF